MKLRVSGASRDCTGGQIKVAGVWRNITRITGKIGGAWKEVKIFAPALTASASPIAVEVNNYTGSAVYMESASVTATPTGGTAPYTYAWARDSGTSAATSPASATTRFGRIVAAIEDTGELWTVTITDSFGQTATAQVDVRFFGIF